MGFWRSLRQWWNWDGTPETDPFRDRVSDEDGAVSVDVSGHAHAGAETELLDDQPDDDAA
jgi:hypothetical protein